MGTHRFYRVTRGLCLCAATTLFAVASTAQAGLASTASAPPDESASFDILGDMNADGVFDFFDIDPFVLALTAPAEFDATVGGNRDLADINRDGNVDFFDIDPFVNLIVSGESVPVPSSEGVVVTPTPNALALGLIGLIVVARRRR
jgi:hypothetical protein